MIIGGIGGLTLGIGLQRANIQFEIFERAPELKEVGAGIGVWTNAVKLLDRLVFGERISEVDLPLAVHEMCSECGQVLSRTNLAEILHEAKAACYVLYRAELHAAFLLADWF